ncbi:histidine phosphatase family protein [Sediminicoccus sp. KRV36]|uniref:histidine phosphatase family protein n=1 Tax=Sediminicoccus sp. KRV36 TaxID=3133721 RepID=UPI00200F9AC4|nr:histidine phosphatase family protein [Sediminicoccus rosea]UPY37008.1 histidine phosphatase family protein [Sediminicoccus rosea]
MALMLMRHFRPAIGPGICYGATDLDLAEGHEAALAALMARLPALDGVISSPLRRCRLLAEAIAAQRGRAVQLDPRLREMDFGAWEGLPWDDIPRAELDAWAADFLQARPHGGESVAQLRARSHAALAEHRARPGRHLLVTHAGVIKAALATGDRAEDWPASLAFGEFVTI